jgi:hypothetical protein
MRRGLISAFVAMMPFLFAAACINKLLGDPLGVNKPPPLAPITATTRPYAPTPTTTTAAVPTSELQAVPCLADPSRMCMNGTPLLPGTTATITPAPNGWPPPEGMHVWCQTNYSPSECGDQPWLAPPGPMVWHDPCPFQMPGDGGCYAPSAPPKIDWGKYCAAYPDDANCETTPPPR